MISSLWIAKTGLDAQQTNMDVIANNRQTSAPMVSSASVRFSKICFIKRFVSRGRSLLSKPRCRPVCKLVPACARLPPSVCTARATCPRPTTVKTLPSKVRVSSRCSCLTGPPPIPAMVRSVDQNGQLVTAGGFRGSACDHHPGERAEYHHWS